MKLNRTGIVVLLTEPVIFALFYLSQVHVAFYYAYLCVTPFLFFLVSYYVDDIRKLVWRVLLNKDSIVFFSVLAIWLFLLAATHNGPVYVFQTAYFPVFLEEFNFRFILIQFLRRKVTLGRAVIIQAFLYALFYMSFLLFYPSGYPGLYAELFILDNFSMALIYGGIYYIRRNFYIPAAIHISLYLMDLFLPASLGWLAYVTTPA